MTPEEAELILRTIAAEPELEDPMPEELKQAILDNPEFLEHAFRFMVWLTKHAILKRVTKALQEHVS